MLRDNLEIIAEYEKEMKFKSQEMERIRDRCKELQKKIDIMNQQMQMKDEDIEQLN